MVSSNINLRVVNSPSIMKGFFILAVHLAAIRAISSFSNKKRAFKIENVTLISNLILYENMSSNIKLDLFFLLFDYETIFNF